MGKDFLRLLFAHQGGCQQPEVISGMEQHGGENRTGVNGDEAKNDTQTREVAHFSRQQLKGELATGLPHEPNQPLTAITQNVDAAMYITEKPTDRSDEIRGLLGEIDQQAHQAADIIRALRALVRKDGNIPSVFGIRELLEQARRLVLPEARQFSVEIVIPKGPELEVCAVRVQIAQVVANLVRNSIESIAEAGSAKKVVTVAAQQIDDFVQVSVEDTGPGITEGMELFTPFETTKRDGMGLGLSICKSLIEANSGRIWHDCSTSQSRFSFTVPLKGS